jgi:SLOG-like protein
MLSLAPIVPHDRDDQVLLEGPHSRRKELWLVLRAVYDFINGFRTLHFVGPCVTVFGSARIGESHPRYAMAREVGRRVAGLGFTVMTGGGPGLMEAANRGARDAGGRSVGCNIRLAHEQAPNEATRHLERHAIDVFGLRRRPAASRWLGERVAAPPARSAA